MIDETDITELESYADGGPACSRRAAKRIVDEIRLLQQENEELLTYKVMWGERTL